MPTTSGPLSADIHLLGNLLGTIIREQHGAAALDTVEHVRANAIARRNDDPDSHNEATREAAHRTLAGTINALAQEQRRVLIKAFSIYFQLINIAEDQQRIRVLRQRERDGSLRESIDPAIAALREAGVSADDLRAELDRIGVRLVMTAHPTEAKRKEVLVKLRHIAQMMCRSDRENLLPRESQALETALAEEIEELWQTRPTRASRATVADEVDFGVYFFTSVIMNIAVDIANDLRASLETHYPDSDWSDLPPLLHYASWIGGDRDGHPHVTPEVTLTTLRTLRHAARETYLERVRFLREHLTQATGEIPASDALHAAVKRARPTPRFPGELYREMTDIIAARLAADEAAFAATDAEPGTLAYRSGADLLADLRLIANSLREHQGSRVAAGEVDRLIQQVRMFGLHLVPLEVRQDARLHAQAVDEILRHYEICDNYLDLPEDEKQAQVLCEIVNPRPLFPAEPAFSDETNMIIATWRMIADAHRRYGPDVIDTVIASMSKTPSDVLTLLLFASEVGIKDHVDLVPLFETVDDLHNAPAVMAALFDMPEYHAALTARGMRQQIMIGYSDSSKDGGYLASNWGLYVAQQELGEMCRRYGVQVELFHGRGGSIGRGGGPTNHAILAQSPAAIQGRIKMTEQGEVIAYRYSNADIARRHLHQVMHAVLLSTCVPSAPEVRSEWRAAMDILAEAGRTAYRRFVYETPGFMDYWHEATPIHEIALMPIGSRPAKRGAGGFSQVRAIPWVFSWMQSRAIIPSWYGVGHAFEHYCSLDDCEGEGVERLQTMYRDWPFFRTLITNVELDLAKADMGIAEQYAGLVRDEALRAAIFGEIAAEHARACRMVCAITGQDHLLSANPVMRRSIDRRNPYVDPLSFIQVALLRDLRETDPDSAAYDSLLQGIMETVNGIAAGMKTTG